MLSLPPLGFFTHNRAIFPMSHATCTNKLDSRKDRPINHEFTSLALRAALTANLLSLGYKKMTRVQAQSLPLMLAGNDVIAEAETGSGKTAAFGLALLHHLCLERLEVQALVLCPTRELAEQVTQTLRRLARLLPNVKVVNLSGGSPMKPQLDSLRYGAHIIVGTPGRVEKHLEKASLSLTALQTLVIDEADRMLDMGFVDAMKRVISCCPSRRQTLLFSATYPLEIKALATQFMQKPQKITCELISQADIQQIFYEVENQASKFFLLKALLSHYQPTSALIFCNTREQTAKLSAALIAEGFSAMMLNGGMEQIERDRAFIRFVNQSCSLLIATDVAARGLDIKELPMVINFDLAFEHTVHIHRIGRTGRAGSKGLACSLTTPADGYRLSVIEEEMSVPLHWGNVPELMKTPFKKIIPSMVTLCLSAGRKNKIRPTDIVGVLTKEAGLAMETIGKIDITPLYSYVAIHQNQVAKAYHFFQNGQLKGRRVQVKKG